MDKSSSSSKANVASAWRLWPLALLFLLFASLLGNGYLLFKLNKIDNDPQLIAQRETSALIAEVGKLIVLPADEEPTIATVTDPELLKSQPFFATAEKGFKVLLYGTAKKAILYDPINKKIIEVAPINIGDTAAATQ